MRILQLLSALVIGLSVPLMGALPVKAQDETTRRIETQTDKDYFGFDLRTEQKVTLDQCKSACLGDQECRAFTYNTKAKWCFLKSDYNQLNPFPGAVAGKVVDTSSDPDIGAPPSLSFLPSYVPDEARNFRTRVLSAAKPGNDVGLSALLTEGDEALDGGEPLTAIEKYRAALTLMPDDYSTWINLAFAYLNAEEEEANSKYQYREPATSAALNAYLLTRTTAERAEALDGIADGLNRRSLYRPALTAYEQSLALVNSPDVQEAYTTLKEAQGFRIVDHSVDSDSASPRVCIQFSEDLVKSGTDYASFVTVDDAAPKAIEARDRQICVEGLEHSKQYRIAIRQGLPAAIGEVIGKPTVLEVYIRDRAPSVRFTGESFVLPSTARRGIPLVSVNSASVDLRLFRVGERAVSQVLVGSQFLRQLEGYEIDKLADETGAPVWEGKIEVQPELNRDVVTSFPIDEALPDRKPGIYVMTATPEGDRSETWDAKATQWFLVSDIGLTTFDGGDGLTVFTRSLATAKPLANVELSLVARNNDVLGKATTDADGRANFDAGLLRGAAGTAPAVVMADAGGKDFVFLDLTRAGFDLSDRGVEGRPAPGALDVFAWTERGIYRVGETVHVAALARNDAANAVENLPLTFIFSRPDGVEDRRIVSDGAALGGHAVDLPLGTNAMRGAWQIAIHTDPKQPAIATQSFLVEDFTPDRIEFDLIADKSEIAPGESASLSVAGRYLYGAPGSDLTLEGEIALVASREWDRQKGFVFGLADEEEITDSRIPLENLAPTDAEGKATIPVVIDSLPSTTRLLKAELTVRMREGGGRAVERKTSIAIRPEGDMIGIRPDFAGDEVAQGATPSFKVIAVDAEGARKDLTGLSWSLVKVERNYQWYRSNGSWSYEPIESTSKVANGTIDARAAEEVALSFPVDWGRYRLEVESPAADGPVTSYEFDAGWYVEAKSTETPDGLEVALDKESYRAGETAKLQVSPRFAGEMLITIGSERILESRSVTVPAGGTTIDVPVSADWGAGAYVMATLYRPGEAADNRLPARAIGLKWLAVDPAERKLSVSIEAPAKTEPRKPLTIPVSVTGLKAGEEAYVTVAAVDVGILNLTRYQTPDPAAWYFGQRRLGLEMRDIYGRLIDGSLGVTGRIRTGGDGGAPALSGSPPTEKLVAFFSGPVRLDDQGRATVSFDIPQFNGTARIMAVAWTETAVGNGVAETVIREPVVVTSALPKFMAPGDESRLRLEIANTDGPAGAYALTVETGDAVRVERTALPASIDLAAGARTVVSLPLTGVEPGTAEITVRLAHAGGTTVEHVDLLPVRPGVMPVTNRQIVKLAPNGGSITVDRELLASSLIEGASVSIGVSRASAFDIPALLMTLDRYPYGCAEQTTSRALPLLYVSELSRASGLEDDPSLRDRVQEAIGRVLAYQSSSGSFGLWSPGSGDLWLDAYVTDFLTRSREQGYTVPDVAMLSALQNLQNALAYDTDIASRGNEIAYATYVLARNRKASAADLRYYADTQLEAFATPLARAQIAAGLALYGDGQRSERVFASALELAQAKSVGLDRADYGSALRDGAAMLALAGEARPVPGVVPAMIRLVTEERNDQRWTSTQEEAWMLLAARAVRSENNTLSLEVAGAPHAGAFARRLSGEEVEAAPFKVVNRTDAEVDAVLTTVAAPRDPLPAGGEGFTIERTYYTLDGEPANVTEAKQNERYVVVLKMTEANAWPSRVLVNDLLPAGFEIDNPRLVGSADLANFGWLGETEVAHSEFRNDRFVAAFNRDSGSPREFSVAYVVRAVSPGTYDHPPASVEDMYRPQFNARTASGRMEVAAQ